MSLKSSLITYLNTKTGLTNLVGSKIYIGWVEKDESGNNIAPPYVAITAIDNTHEHHLTAATGFVQGRFQFDCYGLTTLSAENVAEQVRQALDGFRGTMGSVFVSTCRLDTDRDSVTPPVEGESRGIYAVQQDYIIGWSVSVPTFA